jgi:hypothetical protein
VTLRTPASICFSETNDVFVPGFNAGTLAALALLECATAEPIMPSWPAAMAMAAVTGGTQFRLLIWKIKEAKDESQIVAIPRCVVSALRRDAQCVCEEASPYDAVNAAAFFLMNSCTLSGPCPVSVRTSSDIRS